METHEIELLIDELIDKLQGLARGDGQPFKKADLERLRVFGLACAVAWDNKRDQIECAVKEGKDHAVQ